MFTPKRTLLHLANQAYLGFKGNRRAFANEKTPETLATLEKPKEKGAAMEVYEKLTSNTFIKKWDKAKNAGENFKTVAEKLFPNDQAKQDIAGKMLIEALQGTHPETALNREKNVYFLLENGGLHFFRAESEKKTQEDIDKMIGDPASYEIRIPAKGVQTTAPEHAFTKEDQEKAIKIYEEANEKFKKGDFAGALPGFQEADKLVPDAMPKYKIAVSLDKLGRTQEAIDQYRKFLDSNPDITKEKMKKHVEEAKARIEELKKTVETKSEGNKNAWDNPDKNPDAAEKAGTVDRKGRHYVKNDTSLYSYNGEIILPITANRKKAEVSIIDGNLYKISGEVYARVQFRFKENEGWVRYSDLYTAEKTESKITESDLEEQTKLKEMGDELSKYETGKEGALKFATPEEEYKTKLRDILKYAEEGDVIDVTTDKGETQTATFKNGDFYYKNGRRAIILNGYKLGTFTKAEKTEVREQAGEKTNSIGSIEIGRKGLDSYLKIAKALLNEKNSLEDLQNMGFQIKDEASLKELRASGIFPYDYAEILKKEQIGNTIFVVMVTKESLGKLAIMEEKTRERRYAESNALSEREKNIIAEKTGDAKLTAIDEDQLLNKGDKFQITDKNLVALVEGSPSWRHWTDTEAWNKAWDEKGQIDGLPHLVELWRRFAGNRSENELRDIVRNLIVDAKTGITRGINLNTFIEAAKLYIKKDGTAGTGDELYREFTEARVKYDALKPELKTFYDSGKAEELYNTLYDKMEANKKRWPEAVSDPDKLFYGLTEDEINFASTVFQSDNYRTYERYHYVNNVLQGSVLMMDAITKLNVVTPGQETVQERALNRGEQRLDEIFDRNDKGKMTMSDIAGTTGKEGVTRLASILGIKVRTSEQVEKGPDFWRDYSSGEAAFVSILDRCRNPNTHEVDEKKLTSKMNELLQLGIWSLARNPSIDREELYKTLGITPPPELPEKPDNDASPGEKGAYAGKKAAYDRIAETAEKSLYDTLKLTNLDAEPDAKKLEARKNLVRIGYLVDISASQGRAEKYEAGSPELDVEKLSPVPAVKMLQIELLNRGYDPSKIDKVPELLKREMKPENISAPMVAGALVDFGDFRKLANKESNVGGGLGVGIPLDDGFSIGLALGRSTDGFGQLGVGIGYGGKIDQYTSGAVGVGTNIPLSGDIEKAGGPRVAPSIGAGLEFTVPLSDKSSWDFFAAPYAATNMRQLVEGGPNLGIGAVLGFKWNPDKAVNIEEKEQLAAYELKEIDDALTKGDKEGAFRLMLTHRTFGKLASYLYLKYGWSDDDVIAEYQKQKEVIKMAAVEGVDPTITRVGLGVGVNAGKEGIEAGPTVVLAFALFKTITLYRTETRTPNAMLNAADERLDAALIDQVKKQFGSDKEIKFSERTAVEPAELIRHEDGQMGVGVRENAFDLRKFVDEGGKATIEKYNEGLKGTGLQLKEGEGDMKGLLEIVIPELADNSDPTYNKRSLRMYIDPGLQTRGEQAEKGLILRNGKIYLATTANPDLIFKRLDYHTPFPDSDGATAHTIITLSDAPQRTEREIMANSNLYIQKRPDQPLSIRTSGNGIEQKNVKTYENYKQSGDKLEKYSEKDWSPYFQAADERSTQFEKLNMMPLRPGLTREELTKSGSFSDKFYKQYHLQYKDWTTARPGHELNFEALYAKIKEEFAKDPAYKGQPELNVAELDAICVDLTRRSWAAVGENPQERDALFKQRLDWAEAELAPLWQKQIDEINNRRPGTITHTGKELVKAVVTNLRDTNVNGPATPLPENSITTTLAGTEGIEGYRPNSGVKELLGLDKYDQYQGQKDMNGEIARVILETQSPLPEGDKEFMHSPLALRTFSKLGLILYFTPEESNEVTACFRDGLVAPANRPAYTKFKDLVSKIREAELNGNGANIINLENGYFIRLRPRQIASGVDPTCANFSMTINEDFDLTVNKTEGIVAGGEAREHMTVSLNEIPRWFQFGIGAMGFVGPENKPTPPGGGTPEQPVGGRGGKSQVGGGLQAGGVEHVKNPNTPIGKGAGDNGSPTNPDQVP